MTSIEELRPDLDLVELKPGQVLLIKKPETGKDWLIATFDSVAEAITDWMSDEDEPPAIFNYDDHEVNPQKTLEEVV